MIDCSSFSECRLSLLAWLDERTPLLFFFLTGGPAIVQLVLMLGLALALRKLSVPHGLTHVANEVPALPQALTRSALISYGCLLVIIATLIMSGLHWSPYPTERDALLFAQNTNYFIVFAMLGDAALIPILISALRNLPSKIETLKLLPERSILWRTLSITALFATCAVIAMRYYGHAEIAPQQNPYYLGMHANSALVLTWALWVVAFLPIVEEYFFRGVLQAFVLRYKGPSVAIAVQAIAFAGMHASISRLPELLIVGILLGVLAHLTRSLLPSIIAHGFLNLLAFG